MMNKDFQKPVPQSFDYFQPAGFGTAVSEDAGVEDGSETVVSPGHWVFRPTPMYPRPLPTPSPRPQSVSPQVELESADLWNQFDELTTEMVITKSGRSVYIL